MITFVNQNRSADMNQDESQEEKKDKDTSTM